MKTFPFRRRFATAQRRMRIGASVLGWGVLASLVLVASAVPAVAADAAPGLAGSSQAGVRHWSEEDVQRALGPSWRALRTPHVRVLAPPHLTVTRDELLALETECLRLASVLQIDAVRMESLRALPLRYYYTHDDLLISRFLPYRATGVAFPGLGLTIARRIPFGHELAHLLVHRAVVPAADGNEPLLQEGLASWLAGDGEFHPRAVLALGDRALDAATLDVGMLWSPRRFDAAPGTLEEKYAVSARFVDFLVAERGVRAVLDLYRVLCEPTERVAARPVEVVIAQVEEGWGDRWPRLLRRFHTWRLAHPIEDLRLAPRPARGPDRIARDADLVVSRWRDEGGATVFELRSERGAPQGELSWGGRSDRGGATPLAAPARSVHRFALRFDEGGAQLVDRSDGRVMAECHWSPDEDSTRRTLRLSLDAFEETVARGLESFVVFAAPRLELPRRD